jgi:hypothetical protein
VSGSYLRVRLVYAFVCRVAVDPGRHYGREGVHTRRYSGCRSGDWPDSDTRSSVTPRVHANNAIEPQREAPGIFSLAASWQPIDHSPPSCQPELSFFTPHQQPNRTLPVDRARPYELSTRDVGTTMHQLAIGQAAEVTL